MAEIPKEIGIAYQYFLLFRTISIQDIARVGQIEYVSEHLQNVKDKTVSTYTRLCAT